MQVISGVTKIGCCSAYNRGWLPIRIKALLVDNCARTIAHLSDRSQVVLAVEVVASANRLTKPKELFCHGSGAISLFTNLVTTPHKILCAGQTAARVLQNLRSSPQSI